MRVLIVEDHAATAQSMEMMWRSEGAKAYWTRDGEEAVELAKIYQYDLVTVDNVGDMTALKLVAALRRGGVAVPVLAVGGFSTVEARCALLAAGADGVLLKPIHRDELLAMGKTIVRRSQGRAGNVVNVGPAVVDLDTKSVTVEGKNVHLTGKEFGMLELLIARRDLLVTKEAFLNHLYGGMDEPEMKIIDVFICKLRNKLRDPLGGEYIDTIWGRGYTLRSQPVTRNITTKSPYVGKRLAGHRRGLMDTKRGCLLVTLARNGGKAWSAAAINNRMTDSGRGDMDTTRACLSMAARDGLIVASGPHGQRVYAITDAGTDWLEKNGYEPEAEAA